MSDLKKDIARILLDIRAVHFYDTEPFVFTSGTRSPVYVDCRKLISFPSQRRAAMAAARTIFETELRQEGIQVIAGGETAGIPYAAWLADALKLPMIYVRKEPKGFGRMAQIEGELKEGVRVLLVEDLSFDAGSKISFCEVLRQAGAVAEHTLVLFDYAVRKSRANLAEHNIQLHALTDWPTLLTVAEEDGYFSSEQAAEIRSFLDDPRQWGKKKA